MTFRWRPLFNKALEQSILERQYLASPFAQQLSKSRRRPTKLDIFDFDSTLFLSPLLSPTIWHPALVNAVTTENLLGPGWWRDIRSLELGSKADLEKTAWNGYWNEDIVERARKSLGDPDSLTVVLTGRRYHPFHRIIPDMLSAKQLNFDMVCLRPDPELADMPDIHHRYNTQPSVFKSTMDFKNAFILHMLNVVPSLKTINMWDDRLPHVKKFQAFLGKLKLASYKVYHVPAVRPRYNSSWEKQVVHCILETHNKAVLRYRAKTEDKACHHHNNRVRQSPNACLCCYQLSPVADTTIIALSEEAIKQIRDVFDETYKKSIRRQDSKYPEWRRYAERPEFFGDRVILDTGVISKNKVPLGGLGSRVKVKVVGMSQPSWVRGFALKVVVCPISDDDQETYTKREYVLPLYYRPSSVQYAFRYNDWDWDRHALDESKKLVVQGKVNYGYLLTAEPVHAVGKRALPDDDTDCNK